jgi:hypothetical protein
MEIKTLLLEKLCKPLLACDWGNSHVQEVGSQVKVRFAIVTCIHSLAPK